MYSSGYHSLQRLDSSSKVRGSIAGSVWVVVADIVLVGISFGRGSGVPADGIVEFTVVEFFDAYIPGPVYFILEVFIRGVRFLREEREFWGRLGGFSEQADAGRH